MDEKTIQEIRSRGRASESQPNSGGLLRDLRVHVLTYDHKHGTDVFVFRSHLAAVIGGAKFCRDYLADFTDDPDEIDEFIRLSDTELINAWCDISGGNEFMNIEEHSIL